jgi:two-component system, OmpR family, response regulator
MNRHKVLLVDDDRGLVDMLSMSLEDAGFLVDRAHDGEAGWARFRAAAPDLVVLDLLMPELDGLELCRRIRGVSRAPIVMLTSRDQEMDKVLGLEIGADDYMTKPFSTRELIARIRAALRRSEVPEQAEGGVSTVRDLHLDRGRRTATAGGVPLALTVTEFDLLWVLTSRPGQVFARDSLRRTLYGDIVVSERTLDTFVKRLRAKLRDARGGSDEIETVRGIGYRYRE